MTRWGRTTMTIDEAIARIPQWRTASSWTASPLPGGITNVNYRVEVDGEAFVVRIEGTRSGRLGIDRTREYHCLVAASRSGVGPEVVYCAPAGGLLVTRFIAGRRLTPEEAGRPEIIQRIVHSLRLYHDGPAFDGLFSPFQTLEDYLTTARALGSPLPDDIGWMYGRTAEIAAALRPGEPGARPTHNDLWGPNLIDDGRLVRIVDWEYAAMGDVSFDLANFSIHHTLTDDQDEALLRAYVGHPSDVALARMKLWKIIAELREGMWCMVGMDAPGGDFDFLGYAATHFDRYRRTLADSRVPRWLAQAAAGA
jgi:thiamine kinase-like enzyme